MQDVDAEHMKRKLSAVWRFVDRVTRELSGEIYAIFLFGSVAKRIADADSDIDILVVARYPSERLYDVLANAAFDTYLKTGESIEFVVMSLEEWLRLSQTSLLVHEVRKFGRLLYLNGAQVTERCRSLLDLAEHYKRASDDLVWLGYLKVALDVLYNAIELIIKALIILAERPLPRSHGGYLHVFGELYVRTGRARSDLARDLHKCLEARNRARCEPEASVSIDDLDLMQRVYSELRELLLSLLRSATR